MFVGRDYTIVTCGVNLLNLELYEECLRTLGPGMGWNLPEQLGMQSERDSSAQRAVRHQITHVGEPGGSS